MEREHIIDLDLAAFNHLFAEYQRRFIRFAMSYVADSTIAEDLVMESFVAAWQKRETLTCQEFPPYTLTIVKNKCLNHLRSLQVRSRAAGEIYTHSIRVLQTRIATLEACDPEELFSEETRRLVQKALETLPERTREIIVRSRFSGESYKEIAQQMNITVKSVEFEVSKAIKLLRIALKGYLTIFIFWFCC